MVRLGLLVLWLLLVLFALPPSSARSESELRFPVPREFGVIPAATYDERGRRVGKAHLVIEQLDNGDVRLFAESGIDGAERTVVDAVLEPVDGDGVLRLREQSSRSFDATGRPLGVLSVDHPNGQGRCDPGPGSNSGPQLVELPKPDRVANIPVNLLALLVARGDAKEIKFQLLFCSGGPRLINATASVAGHSKTEDGVRDIVEVRYTVDLGPLLSSIARPFVPQVAVWIDPESPEGWIAHRMPLFAKGPMVLVVRTGIAPAFLNGK